MNTKNDLVLAQQIITNKISNINNNAFHSDSFIYKFSNENITNYFKYLQSKNNALSVVSSGDQILNTVLAGTYNIDAFDISRFPKYFLNLKIASIKVIEKSDYIKMFINTDEEQDEYYDDLYSEIRKKLSVEDQIFWDNLLNFFDWNEIYSSTLFSKDPYQLEKIIKYNPYLQDNNYDKLKKNLIHLNINFIIDDIKNISQDKTKNYDLINLSNIIYYTDLDEYLKMLKKLNLQDNGYSLTYLYDLSDKLRKKLSDENINIESFENSTSKILVYRK